ncbi:VCBS repeat-containing protein [Persicimonas caeni]|uniref:VCBS repeat-containing protein n=1 Tax=Persicimonas caeni TaxID=2292766 RepID=UPI00143D76FA|nr:VCBS repeat-containing protein [Persicimonas caeni]
MAALFAASACSSPAGQACEADADCQPGYECVSTGGVAFGSRICLLAEEAPVDASDTSADTPPDTGRDAADTVSDTVSDTANDVAPDVADASDTSETDTCDEGCGVDTDGDGVIDSEDGCPNRANPHQRDRDADGVQDACDYQLSVDFADASFFGPTQSCCGGTVPWRVAGGGDLTGDGRDDIVITGHRDATFALWVIDGSAALQGAVDLNSAVATLEVPQYGDRGLAVDASGDVNGDGVDDLLVGQPGWNGDKGRALLFLGGAGLRGDLLRDGPDGEYYERIEDRLGYAVDIAPDLNGDGLDDMVVSEGRGGGVGVEDGRVHIIFGRPVPTDRMYLGPSEGADVRLLGTNDEGAGRSLAGVGDINGDGLGDLVVGAPLAAADAGAAYVVYGNSTWTDETFEIGDVAVHLTPPDSRSAGSLGAAVSPAGDLDGDGARDLLVGEPLVGGPDGADESGAVYVVFGGSTLGTAGSLVPIADASVRLQGTADRGQAGSALAAVGDLDGDGFDDVLVGAPLVAEDAASMRRAGAVHLVYGSEEAAQLEGQSVEMGEWARDFVGPNKEASLGFSVSPAGDIDADGRPDVLVTMSGMHDARDVAGAAFLFYGQ